MSVHVIYYKDGAKMMRPVLTEEEYLALRNSRKQQLLVKAVREGDEKQKSKLLQMNYSCLPNDDGTLKGSTRMSTTVGMDIDHVPEEEMQPLQERILQKKDELGLMMLEKSVRGVGYHLVFQRREDLSQEENLKWASSLLGVQYDEGAKDITRVFFTTTAEKEDLLFLSSSLFDNTEMVEERGERREEREKGKAKITQKEPEPLCTPLPVMEGSSQGQEAKLSTPLAHREGQGGESLTWLGYPIQKIIDARFAKKLPCAKDSNRHNSSLKLASDLLVMFDGDKQKTMSVIIGQPWVQEIIKERNEDVEQTVKSAAARMTKKESEYLSQSPSKAMQAAIEEVTGKTWKELTSDPTLSLPREGNQSLLPSGGDGGGVPPMPRRLPKLIQLLVSRTPDIYKPAVAHAVFPSLGAHLHKTRFCYIDNVEHEATLMNVLMAGTGAGKDCISKPIDYIMADIRRRDEENLAREKAWKQSCNTRGANKDKQQRPEGLVIQEIDADMTGPAFVMRTAEAEEHFLYTKLNEIDQFDALRGNGRSGAQFQIMCLAFDPNNRFGQTRVGTQSVTEKVCIRFNWNAATTINKGKRYFRSVLTDGPISRINFCTIPEREIGAEIPVYGSYDSEFEEELRPFIENLTKAQGSIDCPQARKLAKKLVEENAEFARLSQSRVYENLSFRATVIAWLKACVLYVANGCKWDKTIEDFCRWSLQYDMWCKMEFFGEEIEQANKNDEGSGRKGGPQNLLDLLPDEFTLEEAKRVRRQVGKDTTQTNVMINTWKKRGYVIKTTETTFIKSEKFKKSRVRVNGSMGQ